MGTLFDNLPYLLAGATLLPLLSFFAILLAGNWLKRSAAYVAVGAIVGACVLSFLSLALWAGKNFPEEVHHDHGHEAHVAHAEHGDADDHHAETPHDSPSDVDPEHAGEEHAGEEHADEEHADEEHADEEHADEEHAGEGHGHDDQHAQVMPVSYEFYRLGTFGDLAITISCYIDALTICMFCMVTLIASCIHFYAMGYMHDEEHDITDHEVTLSDGSHLHRPGRYHRFFQYLSLFCFSMLGLVLAGNIAMVFVFWELVGICSYFLIGFYVERKSASTAANKAFIVNRVGDFGMIIGLMIIWSTLGTFAFGTTHSLDGEVVEAEGIFQKVRTAEHEHALAVPDGMVIAAARDEVAELVAGLGPDATQEEIQTEIAGHVDEWRRLEGFWGAPYGYWLLIVAGLGIFCGCVGKSAQFPLHVWLPDAMEGPTPVSALVHSATMVAAGVYLVGRFYPVFTPEVLFIIAVIGMITLFMAATIAITATDIKRVLAYSTVSQLGYMMLALGVGGWIAGMLHLITHAFFKSLLFMCSGSVIHAVHTNEMTEMGGLRKKMPVTAYTMLIGCLAIAGAGVPYVVGFSGYYSKDKILEQAFSFMQVNAALGGMFFIAAAGGAAITAFYMFRLWYLTFAGKPRDQHRYDHAHESPRVMYVPLIVLSVFAIAVAWRSEEAFLVGLFGIVLTGVLGLWYLAKYARGQHGEHSRRNFGRLVIMVGGISVGLLLFTALWTYPWNAQEGPGFYLVLENMLEQARPVGTLATTVGPLFGMTWPSEPLSHAYATPITALAFGTALAGFLLATVMYGLGKMDPNDVRTQFSGIYRFLVNKWWFDELYDLIFVKPVHVVSRFCASFDRTWIDGIIHFVARATKWIANTWEAIADRGFVDGSVNLMAGWFYSTGVSLHRLQTGRIRHYVMFIVVATILVFVLVSLFWNPALAK